ncbi:UbiX family flavin prenyltransferase [Rhizomicrobium electricum]|uniref:UbiX family flavin prenyltransferase n=1 Tax=Rhizomicrobium electricum TaxID=480070 RepID=UPI00313329CA|nr:4-hydroxy-3-polyprenylbenzoate decarboxylase [Rhizomicrobium electricum]
MSKAGKNERAEAVPPRLVIGISGASGVIYGIRLLDACKDLGIESHLVVSKAAQLTIGLEADVPLKAVLAKADAHYAPGDVGASIASGSFPVLGMAVVPCSIRSMSEIATGVTASLLTRAADVTLKERRRLVLAVRETPLHLGHLRTMTALTEMGAIILPPVPAFYVSPHSLEDLVDHFVGRILDCFGYNWAPAKRWNPVSSNTRKAKDDI